ncbi:MAG: hypothetical protein Q9181_005789, partial [Wetmoreana brouardii]
LVISGSEDRSWDVDQDGYPTVVQITERLAAKEDGRHDSGSQVTSKVGADSNIAKSPYHGRVSHSNSKRRADGRNERVGRVEVGPDDHADEAIDEEFGQEEIPQIPNKANVNSTPVPWAKLESLTSTVVHQSLASSNTLLLEHLNLRPVHAEHEKTSDKSTEDLTENIMRYLPPWKPLPDGEANRDGRVEVASRRGCARNDGKGDADGESPSDLKERPECYYAHWTLEVQGEGGNGSNTGEAGHTLPNILRERVFNWTYT